MFERKKMMFDKYCDDIKKLDSFEKEDILNTKFELFSNKKYENLLCSP